MLNYRKIFSVLLLIGYASMVFRTILPIIDYALNYKYISEELCVEKSNPENDCLGKCFLTKQIQNQIENSSNAQKIVLIEFVKIPHFYTPSDSSEESSSLEKVFIPYQSSLKKNVNNKPLLPPPKYFG